MNFNELIELIERTDATLRSRAASAIDHALVVRNWLLGRHIVEFEQHGTDRARYGDRLIRTLAEDLRGRGAKGLSFTTLNLCRQFHQTYRQIVQTPSEQFQLIAPEHDMPDETSGIFSMVLSIQRLEPIVQTVSDELVRRLPLPWSHYVFLMQIRDGAERSFYEIESTKERWCLQELKRQFNSGLYERLTLSCDKNAVLKLSQEGQLLASPADAVKNPYVLEFLGLHEHSSYSESDLEQAIINKLEHFLMELGKGFLFHSRQFRLTFDEKHFWVDLVFYNRLLRCFVLVDLKIGELTHQDIGQMQMYVNYFDRHVRQAEENPTIGILLCKTKSDALVEMTLPQGNQTIFASRYQLYLPSKEELRAQIKDIQTGETT